MPTAGYSTSYSESYLRYVDGYDLVAIIGSPTAVTNGNVNQIDLPCGYTISWTGIKVVKQDGFQLYGIGILPEIEIANTLDGIKSGRDEVFEKGLE